MKKVATFHSCLNGLIFVETTTLVSCGKSFCSLFHRGYLIPKCAKLLSEDSAAIADYFLSKPIWSTMFHFV